MHRYEVIPSRCYRHKESGMQASLYGAHPAADGNYDAWEIVMVGWTVKNLDTGTVGIGRLPWKTQDEAQAWISHWEAKRKKPTI